MKEPHQSDQLLFYQRKETSCQLYTTHGKKRESEYSVNLKRFSFDLAPPFVTGRRSLPTFPPFVLTPLLFALIAVSFCSPLSAQEVVSDTRGTSNVPVSQQWSQWRGPLGTGESPTAKPPTRWSETENIKWKVPMPGLGHSTPAVWGDNIFVTTAIPFGPKFEPIHDGAPGSHDNVMVSQKFKFEALAYSRANGKIKWQKTLHAAVPHEGGHVSASLASGCPVTDGTHLIAYFGTHGLYCLDYQGNVVWKKTLGKMKTKHAHGEGASPALLGDILLINWDHEGESFVVALDKSTGKELWRQPREEVTSWSSPILYQHRDRVQAIVAGTGAVRGYDAKTGEVIWSCSGLSNNIVATPIAKDGIVYVGSSYEIRSMMAILLDGAKGDITGTNQVLWQRATRTPYVPTPLLYRGNLYFLKHYQGILTIAQAKTGEEVVGPFRLGGIRDIYASPVAADGKIFITDRNGVTLVLSEPDMPRVLAANVLKDSFSASAVLVEDEILLRGEKFLYCISESKD